MHSVSLFPKEEQTSQSPSPPPTSLSNLPQCSECSKHDMLQCQSLMFQVRWPICVSQVFPPSPPFPPLPPPPPASPYTCPLRLAPSCSLVFCLRGVKHSGMLPQAKVQREHLKLCTQPTLGLTQPHADYQQHSWQEADTFTTMLTNLVHSRTTASTAKAVGMLHHHLLQPGVMDLS